MNDMKNLFQNLVPCPKCNIKRDMVFCREGDTELLDEPYKVVCKACGTSTINCESIEEAAEKWNAEVLAVVPEEITYEDAMEKLKKAKPCVNCKTTERISLTHAPTVQNLANPYQIDCGCGMKTPPAKTAKGAIDNWNFFMMLSDPLASPGVIVPEFKPLAVSEQIKASEAIIADELTKIVKLTNAFRIKVEIDSINEADGPIDRLLVKIRVRI